MVQARLARRVSGGSVKRRRSPAAPAWRWVAFFCLPALLLFSALIVYPMVTVAWYSLHSWVGTKNLGFTGLRNYSSLLNQYPLNQQWPRALWHTVIFFIGAMLIQNVISLTLAVVLFRNPAGKRVLQTLISIPYLISPLIVGYIWTLILSPRFGPLNALLSALGHDSWAKPWLGTPSLALPILILVNTWQWVGGPMLIFGAGLAAIPAELEEAASIDGANRWDTFWRIRLPLLVPSLGVVTVTTFIGAFNTFDLVYALGGSNGGPGGAMDVLALVFYRTAFNGGGDSIGTSSAYAVCLFIMIFGVAFGLDRFLRSLEVEA